MKPQKNFAVFLATLLVLALSAAIFSLPAAAANLPPNVALEASVSTSSDYNEEYAGWRCVHDGWAEHDSGTEWASDGEMTPWIRFEFDGAVSINQIVLCDRSNTTDWSRIVRLTFDDGTQITTEELDDDGYEYTLDFDLKNVTWVQFDVIEAGEISLNNGFGRISMYNTNDAPTTEPPTEAPATEAPTDPPAEEQAAPAEETGETPAATEGTETEEGSNIIVIVLVAAALVAVVVVFVIVLKAKKKPK